MSHNKNSTFGPNSRTEHRRVTKKFFVCIISPSLTTTCKETSSFPLLKVREFTSRVTGLVQGKANVQTRFDWLARLLFELLYHLLSASSSEVYLWLFLLFLYLPKPFRLLGLSISTSSKRDDWFLMRTIWSFEAESWNEANMYLINKTQCRRPVHHFCLIHKPEFYPFPLHVPLIWNFYGGGSFSIFV